MIVSVNIGKCQLQNTEGNEERTKTQARYLIRVPKGEEKGFKKRIRKDE